MDPFKLATIAHALFGHDVPYNRDPFNIFYFVCALAVCNCCALIFHNALMHVVKRQQQGLREQTYSVAN